MSNICKPSIGPPKGENDEAALQGVNPIQRQWMTHVEREVMEDISLSCGARLTYVILCGYEGKNCKVPYPSLATLVKKVGCGRGTIQGYLSELKKAGRIEIVPRRERGKFCSNGYRILRPAYPLTNGSAVDEKHRSDKNRLRESLLLRNTSTKESHYNKYSQREGGYLYKPTGQILPKDMVHDLLRENPGRENELIRDLVSTTE